MVVARALADPAYGDRVVNAPDPYAAFRAEVVDLHPRLRRWWPRSLGATPWAVARELRRVTGERYAVRWVWPRRRLAAWQRLHGTVREGALVAVYVGNRWSPRHVVLAHRAAADAVSVYEPSHGQTRRATAEMFVEGRLRWGWRTPWALVVPRS